MKKGRKRFYLFAFLLLLTLAVTTQASTKVKINKKTITLIKGQTATLKIVGTKERIKWTSSKKSVATVSKRGKVKARKKGTARIIAKAGKRRYTCKIKVEAPEIDKSELKLMVGENASLKMIGNSQKVSWKSSNQKIATVTQEGTVRGTGVGSCKITASISSKKYVCTVSVSPKVIKQKDTEKQVETEKETEREKETEKQTESETETERQTEPETEKETETEEETEKQTEAVVNPGSLLVLLTNEYQSVAFNSGTYVEFPIQIYAETKIMVYYSGLDITNLQTFPAENGVQYKVTEEHGLEGRLDLSTHTYTATKLLDDTGYADITVTYHGVSKTVRFTVAKIVI